MASWMRQRVLGYWTNLGFSCHLHLTEILMGALEESYSLGPPLSEMGALPNAEIKWTLRQSKISAKTSGLKCVCVHLNNLSENPCL